MNDLKPCPFCGGRADLDSKLITTNSRVTDYQVKISCNECFVEMDISPLLCKKFTDESEQDYVERVDEIRKSDTNIIKILWDRRCR